MDKAGPMHNMDGMDKAAHAHAHAMHMDVDMDMGMGMGMCGGARPAWRLSPLCSAGC